MLGLGLTYDFDDRFGIRAEWEGFFAVGDDEETGESDVDLSVSELFSGFRERKTGRRKSFRLRPYAKRTPVPVLGVYG